MYTHTRVYMNVYEYLHTDIHIYIYIYIHMHLHTHTCTHIYIRMHMHTYAQIVKPAQSVDLATSPVVVEADYQEVICKATPLGC